MGASNRPVTTERSSERHLLEDRRIVQRDDPHATLGTAIDGPADLQ
jgi:hypothetical protein